MSTEAIIAIVAIAVLLIALALFVLPRTRAKARHAKAERELERRREQATIEHRQAADAHAHRAAEAERKARMAQQVAERERAESGLRSEQAELHASGAADEELVADHERDGFADLTGRQERGTDHAAPPAERTGRFTQERDVPADERAVDEERLRRR